MTQYPLYCGGEFMTSATPLEVKNPYNGSVVATTYLADTAILEQAIVRAQAVMEELRAWPAYKRYEALYAIHKALVENRTYLGEVLCKESAKPIRYAIAEIDRAAQTFLIAAEESKRLPKEYLSLDWTSAGTNRQGIVNYFPIGLVAGIAPFNFPMNLAVHKLAPAIATGCPIILKPASSTPLSTLELAKIIDRTELPKGAVSILPMDRETGNQLVTDERFQLLSFTGSPVVGWKMKQNSGKKKVVLELGGNAGVIITASAKPEEILKKCIVGGFSYSGQICIHAQRFFVHPDHYPVFVARMTEQAKHLNYGDPLLAETEISHMIDEENAIRTEAWIREAVEQGAKLLCGGGRQGTYVEPTVLTNCNNTMKVYAEEVFGPVVCIESYNGHIEDAVRKINDSKFGLQCGVFTDSVAELNYCFATIQVGGVIHNDAPTLRFDHMPYGGVKESGLGREGVRYAIHDMLEPKILVSAI